MKYITRSVVLWGCGHRDFLAVARHIDGQALAYNWFGIGRRRCRRLFCVWCSEKLNKPSIVISATRNHLMTSRIQNLSERRGFNFIF